MQRVSRAEKFSADRGKLSLFFTLVSVVWTVSLILQINDNSARWPAVLVWVAWLVVPMMWVFGQPAAWRWSERERRIINDELVHEHQRTAAVSAMFVLIGGLGVGSLNAVADLTLPAWWPIAALSAGVVVGGFRFGWLQNRSSE